LEAANVTLRLEDDAMEQMLALTSKLPQDLKAKFKAFFASVKPDEIDLECPLVAPSDDLPAGAVSLSDFHEVVVPGTNNNCAIYAFIKSVEHVMKSPYAKDPKVVREELFSWLGTHSDVPLVGKMSWRGYAGSLGKTVDEQIAIERGQPGLTNFAYAGLGHMFNFGLDIYSVCRANPNYVVLTQRSLPSCALATTMAIFRGESSFGHYNALFVKEPSEVTAAPRRVVVTKVDLALSTPPRNVQKQSGVAQMPAQSSPLSATCTPTRPNSTSIIEVFGSPVNLSTSAIALITSKMSPTSFTFGPTQPISMVSPQRLEWRHPIVGDGGKLKYTMALLAVYQEHCGRRSSSLGCTTEVTHKNSYLAKLNLYFGIPSAYARQLHLLDTLAARYVHDAILCPIRQKTLHDIIDPLKIRSNGDFDTFRRLLFNLDGAYPVVEDNNILPVTYTLIGKRNPASVSPDPSLRGLNPAMDYATDSGKSFSMPHGQRHNPDGTCIVLTAANTAAFTRIDGFDNNRPLLAVLAFEGVLSVSNAGRMYFRVQAHLLRYVLLDVDGTIPHILSTPARDPFNNNPIDDFDD